MQIPFDYYEHPEAPTIEIAAQFYRGEGTTLCKNLFFRNHKGNRHYLVIMDSRFPMDIHDMEHRLHQGKLSFASPEQMEQLLDTSPGSASVLGLMNDTSGRVRLLVDRDLLKEEFFGCHPCRNTSSLRLRTGDVFRSLLPAMGHEPTFVDLPWVIED